MSGLGVLADYYVCVPLTITRQRGLFCLLVCRGTPFLLWCGCRLSPYPLWHAPSGLAQPYPFGWCVILARHFPQKSPGRNLKIGLPLSPPTMPSYLWPMTSLCPILAGYRLVRSGSCTCLSSICVQNLIVALSSVVVYRLAYIAYRLFFDLLCELLFDFPLPLRADIYLLLGLTLLSAHFLIALISCHITLSFLP